MTGMFVPSLMVANAKADVGFREGPNNRNPYSFWQYGNYNQPYCDSAVCYWAWLAGFRFPSYSAHGERGDSWVTGHRQHAIRQGIWRSRDTIARPNWLAVFYFTMPDQHIEMVLSDQGGSIATIGGNTSDMVAYRVRSRRNVVGFIALDEAGQNAPPGPTPVPTSTEDPMLVKPAAGDKALNRFSGAHITFGDASNIAATGDCKITPDPKTVTIKKPYKGAIGWGGADQKLLAGEFVVVGDDLSEYKFKVV